MRSPNITFCGGGVLQYSVPVPKWLFSLIKKDSCFMLPTCLIFYLIEAQLKDL
jgi:hypothetical protein